MSRARHRPWTDADYYILSRMVGAYTIQEIGLVLDRDRKEITEQIYLSDFTHMGTQEMLRRFPRPEGVPEFVHD